MNQAGLSSSREEPTELLGACLSSFLFAFSLLFIAPLLPLLQMQAYDLDKSGDFVSAHRQQGFFFFFLSQFAQKYHQSHVERSW